MKNPPPVAREVFAQTFAILLKHDMAMIPICFLMVQIRFHRFIRRGVFEEKNLFFILLAWPYLVILDTIYSRKAARLGVSQEKFIGDEAARIEQCRKEIRQREIQYMCHFADVFPGATIHDFENAKRIRFLLPAFVAQWISNRIFGE